MSSRADTVGIAGAGTFGTSLAAAIARNGRRVVLWSRDRNVVDSINRDQRCPRMPDVALPTGEFAIDATHDPNVLARQARFIVMAVVSTDVRERAVELGAVIDGNHVVIHAVGALAAPNDERVTDVLAATLPTLRVGALAGPALPYDLANGNLASMVVASRFDEVISETRRLLTVMPTLRIYGSHDVVGVELASALSGAYTIALGLGDGLALGAGPRAVLITRAVAEAGRLSAAAGGVAKTFAGLTGLGNWLVRAAEAERSSEYSLGIQLAHGGVATATSRAVTEGVRAAHAGVRLAKRLNVRVPLLEAVDAVLRGAMSPADAARAAAETVADEE